MYIQLMTNASLPLHHAFIQHGHAHTSHESPFFSLVPVYKSADEARRRHIDVSTILK